MATKYHQHVSTKETPQTEPVPGKPMVENSAGGYTFAIDDWKRLDRFLILGAEGGTYYVKEKALTVENAGVVRRCAILDPRRTVSRIVEISEGGRAPKNDPAVFALALCASQEPYTVTGGKTAEAPARRFAYEAIARVCRTGTHLFHFVAAVDSMRGWGSSLCKAVSQWYKIKTADELAYQVTKYQQRDGWSHRDVLRKCHAKVEPGLLDAVLRYAVSGVDGMGERHVIRGKDDKAKGAVYNAYTDWPESIKALEELKRSESPADTVRLIEKYGPLAPRELVKTEHLTDAKVWGALLESMPMTAMIRNLGNMSKTGLLAPLSQAEKIVTQRLGEPDRIKKARVHPLAILTALRTYQSGSGLKGSGTWTPVQSVVDALNDTFYLAFDAVVPSGKRWFFGLDVSGSMSSPIAGSPLSCCEAATALSLVTTRIEPYTFTGAFQTYFTPVGFGRNTRLDEALRYTRGVNFGATDCGQPMLYAMENKIEADVFCVITDNETYAGRIHPFQALKQYRDKTGIPAKMIVVGMTSTGFTIADPSDAGMLDVVGFSTDVPAVMSDFAKQ